MKNIYTIATDKPSRFWYYKSYEVLLTGLDVGKSSTTQPQNIYITSDENIVEGDYGLGFALGIRGIGRGHFVFKQDGTNLGKVNAICDGSKKIILTTDKDLIRDGVQQIDYFFLKWFLKNQSCDEVKVEGHIYKGQDETEYKIIIPKEEVLSQSSIEGEVIWEKKEEPKQIYYNTVCIENGVNVIKGQFKTKKEALYLANKLNRNFPDLRHDWRGTLVKEKSKQQ
jgi:hypothetical protein